MMVLPNKLINHLLASCEPYCHVMTRHFATGFGFTRKLTALKVGVFAIFALELSWDSRVPQTLLFRRVFPSCNTCFGVSV